MKKSIGVILILIIVLLLGVIGIGGYFLINEKNNSNKEIGELKNEIESLNKSIENVQKKQSTNIDDKSNINTVQQNNSIFTEKNSNVNIGTSNTSLEEQIKLAFLNRLAAHDEIKGYRVERVEILSEEITKEIIEKDGQQYYKQGDILAEVEYDVTPVEAGMAGNGFVQGDWVVGKNACVCYRDGVIVQSGTGW